MTSEDSITQKVQDMYKKFPYPSPSTEFSETNELLNLLRIFEVENKYKFENKNILDAGSGSGHRITKAAEHFKKSNFLGIDISEKSLEIANQLKDKKQINNIRFQKHNILEGVKELGKFDLVLCMGVLHHLANPKKGLKMLVDTLQEDGIIFLYLYGELGGHKRMLNKELISILLGKEKSNYEIGIKLIRDLELNKFEYGWNLNIKNDKEEDALIVDSLLHANEVLYDTKEIEKLFRDSKLYGYAIFGISSGTEGLIFDTAINDKKRLSIPQTNVNQMLKSKSSLERFDKLKINEKCRVIDLLYEPNGYTIIGLTKKAYQQLSEGRIKRNFVII